MPPATQEGNNTVGFTINDEVWIPYYKCGVGQNPCGEIHADYGTPSTALNAIDFMFRKSAGSKYSSLYISSVNVGTITSIGEKKDSVNVEYTDKDLSSVPGALFGKSVFR